MIVLIDNFDSFVYNLARYVEELGRSAYVVRSNHTSVSDLVRLSPQALIISPGPCSPNEAGVSLDAIRYFSGKIPILGVCLGHQAIGQAFGGKIIRASEPCHGKSDIVFHNRDDIFFGVVNPLKVARYHSLIIAPQRLPPEIEITARNNKGIIMAIKHNQWPVYGVQFHPESVLTEQGHKLLSNFLDRI